MTEKWKADSLGELSESESLVLDKLLSEFDLDNWSAEARSDGLHITFDEPVDRSERMQDGRREAE
ncbi:hypothetical protein Poly21_00160 [Allorhodopirellula heiligendammensis]|uniref:Uncharacterized protein n=1 Tax=Allorhodopirellula heiligendammensis TaxID=2714739 RepID=A0A5C6C173_9BACT|nr:hypothetical protein Poly21_00160 [Allorhodopirellula heiligendammensis]